MTSGESSSPRSGSRTSRPSGTTSQVIPSNHYDYLYQFLVRLYGFDIFMYFVLFYDEDILRPEYDRYGHTGRDDELISRTKGA